MFQKLKNKMKDQRGLTLIELLAVIVILAIISAIAIPSILGLINNSKKDAHVANAVQMINATKMAVAGNEDLRPATSGKKYISLTYLENEGYLEKIKDPDKGNYTRVSGTTFAQLVATGTAFTESYVLVEENSGKYDYSVYLANGTTAGHKRIGASASEEDEDQLKRSKVIEIK